MPMLSPSEPQNRPGRVTMIGLDFGSTTSSAMMATAVVGVSSATGRMELGAPQVVYRSDPVFTPFDDERIDSLCLNDHIDRWIGESGIPEKTFFAGGVIITGLAAKQANASEIAKLIGDRIGEAVIATADDPCLESWLAFMGSCSTLSRYYSERPFINLDIGGGTTNPAFGLHGDVLHTGCYFIGARHFRFDPGTYRLTGLSLYGRTLLNELGIKKNIGQELESAETGTILEFYISALEAIVRGDVGFFSSPIAGCYQQVSFAFESREKNPAIVFSGGVGELVYRESQGKGLPGTTYYGDLGIDLARQIARSPILSGHIRDLIPENQGRATVYGLTLHSMEISGQTIFLSSNDILPRRSLPIVARLSIDTDAEQLRKAVLMVETTVSGGCIQVLPGKAGVDASMKDRENPAGNNLEKVKTFGQRLRQVCTQVMPKIPIVVLVSENYGQVLGNYVSNWRQEPFDFVVIDEIPDRQAHFVNIGRLQNTIVPVSFYGVC
jgi:ethanolamine utilization protein EutA